MHRMMMGRRGTNPGIFWRFAAAIRTNSYDPDDVAVISLAVIASMLVGGAIGWVAVEAITSWNTAALCVSACEVAIK